MKKIGFIGCGNMATAIIKGISSNGIAPERIFVFDVDSGKMSHFSEKGMNACSCETDVVVKSDIVFLAVKPQVIEGVLRSIGDCSADTVFVSIAAGISTDTVKRILGYDAKVVRAMPNTPLLLGLGATALSFVPPVSREEFDIVRDIFATSGIVEEVDESMMNSVISVNGSSPAYVYYFAKAVADGAKNQGIDADTAIKLFAKVLEGSAKMLTDSGYTPEQLIDMVCSKGGTTIEAVKILERDNVDKTIDEAMKACTKRAEELDIK